MKQREKIREETERERAEGVEKDRLVREKMEKYEAVRKEQEE